MVASCLCEFVRDVTALFNQGARKSSLKLGPVQMRDKLKRMYPDRFLIPSRAELHKGVSALFMKAKNWSSDFWSSRPPFFAARDCSRFRHAVDQYEPLNEGC